MSQSYFANGSPANYTLGGYRLWIDRAVDLSLAYPTYEGYRDWGNIIECNDTLEKEVLDHYSAKRGSRRKDRTLTKQVNESFSIKLDELSVQNLRNYFNAGAVTNIASPTTASVVDEIHKVENGVTTMLGKGYGATSIVVTNIAGNATYTTDDYTVYTDTLSGYKGLTWNTGGSISPNLAEGDFVRISYTYVVRTQKTFAPLTFKQILCKAVIFGVSDSGNEFIREIEKAQIDSEGDFALNSEDWSNISFKLTVLDDSDANPNFPFGIFRHYGIGTFI